MFDTAIGGDQICSATQAAELPQNARQDQPGWVARKRRVQDDILLSLDQLEEPAQIADGADLGMHDSVAQHRASVVAELKSGRHQVRLIVDEEATVRGNAERVRGMSIHARIWLRATENGGDRVCLEVARKPNSVVQRGK
jgi:hypothetical protein